MNLMGAPSGENRESGVSPERARHCNRVVDARATSSEGRCKDDDPKPGDLPIRD